MPKRPQTFSLWSGFSLEPKTSSKARMIVWKIWKVHKNIGSENCLIHMYHHSYLAIKISNLSISFSNNWMPVLKLQSFMLSNFPWIKSKCLNFIIVLNLTSSFKRPSFRLRCLTKTLLYNWRLEKCDLSFGVWWSWIEIMYYMGASITRSFILTVQKVRILRKRPLEKTFLTSKST